MKHKAYITMNNILNRFQLNSLITYVRVGRQTYRLAEHRRGDTELAGRLVNFVARKDIPSVAVPYDQATVSNFIG